MWVQRTPEELTKWNQSTEKQARSGGLQIGVAAWIIAALILSSGWIVSLRGGTAVQGSWGGTFWTRLPIFAVVTLPIVFIASRYERRKSLRKAASQTICPKCDTSGQGNAGAVCQCGGSFVPQSTMKWVEDAEHEHAA